VLRVETSAPFSAHRNGSPLHCLAAKKTPQRPKRCVLPWPENLRNRVLCEKGAARLIPETSAPHGPAALPHPLWTHVLWSVANARDIC
jgi:hypothetical protein